MDNFNRYDSNELDPVNEQNGLSGLNVNSSSLSSQMTRVYGWMFAGLLITAFFAYITVNSSLFYLVANGFTLLMLVLVELGLVWFLAARAIKMQYTTAAISFVIYSAINGITLSIVLYAYTLSSVAYVFVITAVMFGFMSVYGLVTKADLTSLGSLFFMGLIGLILVSVVNIFLGSTTLGWIISFVGIGLFLGLTAYDTQKIKHIHATYQGTDKEKNVAIVGALELYLDFINLFLYILRLLGKRK